VGQFAARNFRNHDHQSQDFNLLYNNLLKTGEAVVGDTVKIQIDAEMVKKK